MQKTRTGRVLAATLVLLVVLALPAFARMNTPSKPDGNWQWRMAPGAASLALAKRIRALTELYQRLGR